jgi:hypothetical protein
MDLETVATMMNSFRIDAHMVVRAPAVSSLICVLSLVACWLLPCITLAAECDEEAAARIIEVVDGGAVRFEVLETGRHAIEVSIPNLTPEFATVLPRFPELRSIKCSDHCSATDEDVACWSQLNKLEEIYIVESDLTDAALREWGKIERLEHITLHNSKIRGDGLAAFKEHKRLGCLELCGNRLDGATLESLAGVPTLFQLQLEDTQLTDRDLKYLMDLTSLRTLVLSENEITDAGLDWLAALVDLRRLHLRETKVTREGVGDLRRALPKCLIID